MQSVVFLPEAPARLRRTKERDGFLSSFLFRRHRDGLDGRRKMERHWRVAQKIYDANPRTPIRDTPIEGAPNIVVALAATASDSIYATLVDVINNTDPPATCLASTTRWNNHAEAIQRFTNQLVRSQVGLRIASDNAILDDVIKGTGLLVTNWEKDVRIRGSFEIREEGPKIRALPLQDFLMSPGPCCEIDTAQWVSMRQEMAWEDLILRERMSKWRLDGVAPRGSESDEGWTSRDWHSRDADFYGDARFSIWQTFIYFDYNDDGLKEDLFVVWDATSGTIMFCEYNPYTTRPFSKMVYQRRAHEPFGDGVPWMLRHYQYEVTEVHNSWILNALLQNAAIWAAKRGSVPKTLKLWPGRVLQLADVHDLAPLKMAQGSIQPSALAEQVIDGLAERRVGLGDLNIPRPSAVLGSRATATTVLNLQNNINKRFTPVYDSVRHAITDAIRQSLMRYHEQIRRKNPAALQQIEDMRGLRDAKLITEALRRRQWARDFDVHVTATTANMNRASERSDQLQLIQIVGGYYERTVQIAEVIANPTGQIPPLVVETAKKVHGRATELLHKTLNTFESIKDPARYTVSFSDGLDDNLDLSPEGLSGLARQLPPPTLGGSGVFPFPSEGGVAADAAA